ncbi:MAG: NAD(P)H-binding protein [Actinomycetota bacterium]|nr:NAD(P)H-binding protein [Actinomycetota bacterium]
MSASEILVTGGTGTLGRRVVDRLRADGRQVRVLSRSGRPGTVRGDLSTGENLEAAVRGTDTIVHCASNSVKSRQTDVAGTELLLHEAARAYVAHFVFISIVGVDRNPYFPYYRVKLDTERVVERSPVPWTILRATQFHDLLLMALRFLDRPPAVMAIPRGFRFQPIEVGETAGRLAELALSEPAGRVPDVGGPEILTSAQLARAYLEATGREKRLVGVPLPGKAARAVRDGAQLCPEQRYGTIRWEEFLREKVQHQRIGGTTREGIS